MNTGPSHRPSVAAPRIASPIVLVLSIVVVGCAAGRDDAIPFTSTARDREQLFQHLDAEVALVGKAESSADRGVSVLLADGTRVGVPELGPWPRKIAGKTVTVTGKLRRLTGRDPQTVDAPPAELFVVEGARWGPGDHPPRQVRPR